MGIYEEFTQDRFRTYPMLYKITAIMPFLVVWFIALVGVGITLLGLRSAKKYELDYTMCNAEKGVMPCYLVNSGTECTCKIEINFPTALAGPVYVYYGLSNFNQNYRRFARSINYQQMHGETPTNKDQIEQCEGYFDVDVNGSTKTYAPAGLLPRALFNDTFVLTKGSIEESKSATPIPWSGEKITWPVFAGGKYKKASEAYDDAKLVQPSTWTHAVNAFPDAESMKTGQGYENKDLINWIETSAYNEFKKLYRIIDAGTTLEGKYTLTVKYNYFSMDFHGHKHITFATTDGLGMKNAAPGGFSIIIGLGFLIGSAFFIQQVSRAPRSLGEQRPRDPGQSLES